MTIHFLLQLSHNNCKVLSVVGSTKTHLSNWIVLLITLTAVARVPIKVGKRFELTKKHFFVPIPVTSLLWSFLLICQTFNSEVRMQVLKNSCKYNFKNWEGCHNLKALQCIMCFDLLGTARDVWDLGICKLWKVMLQKKKKKWQRQG